MIPLWISEHLDEDRLASLPLDKRSLLRSRSKPSFFSVASPRPDPLLWMLVVDYGPTDALVVHAFSANSLAEKDRWLATLDDAQRALTAPRPAGYDHVTLQVVVDVDEAEVRQLTDVAGIGTDANDGQRLLVCGEDGVAVVGIRERSVTRGTKKACNRVTVCEGTQTVACINGTGGSG